jgi:hypothetical protein
MNPGILHSMMLAPILTRLSKEFFVDRTIVFTVTGGGMVYASHHARAIGEL